MHGLTRTSDYHDH
jgi:hypothetical protein